MTRASLQPRLWMEYDDLMVLEQFHPIVRQWFAHRFEEPTRAQTLGWPLIRSNRHTLIAAPTGSGKTLAAFLVSIDRCLREWFDGQLTGGIHTVYVSPLKALSNDIEKNLQEPLAEISARVQAAGHPPVPIRTAVRTGDTPSSQRQSMLRNPPHILVTTPESLYLLLTSQRAREPLRSVRTVIVDEIHALARDKRGSHLTLSLERLVERTDCAPVRIGLSATQRPLDQIAQFLAGSNCEQVSVIDAESAGADAAVRGLRETDTAQTDTAQTDTAQTDTAPPDTREVVVVDAGHVRQLDLAVEVPPSELEAVCSHDQWGEIYDQITQLINGHRSSLIFVNTRRLAERVTLRLSEVLGEGAVASHHGSLSRETRLSAERRLKAGELKAIVATASLEMGIDIGYIDLVCQIGSPRSIATFLQRIGRSGHNLGAIPRGRLFPLTRDELLECLALVRAVHHGRLDSIEIPMAPLDILAQQIVAAVACDDWSEEALFQMIRRAWPFRNLSREHYTELVELLANGLVPSSRRGAYLHRDQINGRLHARRSARLAAITSGGAIPETAEYRVLEEPERTLVGTVDEDFAIESMAGDIFLLGNTSWAITQVRASEVLVRDAKGAPPSIPFWFGEAPGRTAELSEYLSGLRQEIAERIGSRVDGGGDELIPSAEGEVSKVCSETVAWLAQECSVSEWGAEQAARYVAAQLHAIGLVPTGEQIVFERFFDESGGMQLVIHAPLGARVNRAWGLALRKRFCRSFDFELQAAATDNGILLSIGPQHSFPIDALFKMLGTHNARELLEQAVLAAPMFQVRWRWNVTRALAVLRTQAGKKVPPAIQRFRSDDLLAAAFPETVGCLENHHGDVEIPDHPLVRQTMHDCLHEAMDVERWMSILAAMGDHRIRLVARDTREPSPFSYELLHANPYAFLDDAPLEERRARAVQTRRSVSTEEVRDLARLDEFAIQQVRRDAWPVVRDAEELHDALRTLGKIAIGDEPGWTVWFEELVAAGRAATLTLTNGRQWWIASETWPLMRVLHPQSSIEPAVRLPSDLDVSPDRSSALLELVRGTLQCSGPVTASEMADSLCVEQSLVEAALEQLEGEGCVLRGRFSRQQPDQGVQWCDRRLLARIHRLTVEGLRRRIQPVSTTDFVRFLLARHRLAGKAGWSGPAGVREAIARLQAFDLPFGAWEDILARRVTDFEHQWLDQLMLSGEITSCRLTPPRRLDQRPARASLNRATPLALLMRSDLSLLVSPDRANAVPATSAGEELFDLLDKRGARFFPELVAMTSLLPSQVEEALRELVALGLVISDTYSALRTLAGVQRRGRRPRQAASPLSGRWSCFGSDEGSDAGDREGELQRWCRLLLHRYGVVFRDLLQREVAAPPWRDLVRKFRAMELKGEIRGGRFVSDVGGEQYAEESVIAQLRRVRDQNDEGQWTLLSAADPLNLTGILGSVERVPTKHRNLVVVRGGHWIAAKVSGVVEFFSDLDESDRGEIDRALRTGHRRRPLPTRAAVSATGEWSPRFRSAASRGMSKPR